MTKDTHIQDHSDVCNKVFRVVEAFTKEIGVRSCTTHFEAVLNDGKYLKGEQLGQKPERFVEETLVFPLLRALDHSLRPQPVQYAPRWRRGRGVPDFCLTTVPVSITKERDLRLFGEAKTPNKIEYARNDVKQYLEMDLDFHALTVLSDGFEWELWVRPENGDPSLYTYTDLRPVFRDVKAVNLESESYRPHAVRQSIDEEVFDDFTAAGIEDIVRSEFGIELT